MKKPVIPSSQDTILAILERSKRQAVPLRRSFVRSDGAGGRPLLAQIVRHHDERALDLYLLILAQASGGNFDVAHPAAVWARALGLENHNGVAAISKVLARLVEYKLLERDRVRRQAHLTLLREDGSGQPYAHPAVAGDHYLQLSHEYWAKEFHRQLTLPAKAALLVARSMPDNFFLTIESAPKQFGMSADTIEKGLRELQDQKLLTRKATYRAAPLTADGGRSDCAKSSHLRFTVMGRIHLFADEAGNFDFGRGQSSTQYFILTTVAMEDCEIANDLLKLRRQLAWEGLGLKEGFHAAEDRQTVRDRVFGVLTKHDFRIDATILEKPKAHPGIRASNHQFYETAWFYHFRYMAQVIARPDDELHVIAASLGTKGDREAFHNAMKGGVNKNAPSVRF